MKPLKGGNTVSRFRKLVELGAPVLCSKTLEYFHETETVPDGKGGRIAKKFNKTIQDQTIEKSKFIKGRDWQRGVFL